MFYKADFARLPTSLPPLSERSTCSGLTLDTSKENAALSADNGVIAILIGTLRDETGKSLDANALLARYRARGADCISGQRGDYAVAIIDAAARKVVLANDRMGIRGWCYKQTGNSIQFSDRADTLGQADEIDSEALFSYLVNHMIPSPDTVFQSVKRLPPAHRLVFSPTGSELCPHWVPNFGEPRETNFIALKTEFRSLVRNAVERYATNPNIGTFLSGGTDSSTVAGLVREITGESVPAYSIGFDADGYDEMDYARIAARHFGLKHREYYLTPDDVLAGIPKVATHYDQPFGNSSAVPAFHCARIAREDGLAQILAGDGGDELFGGNTRYAKQRVFGWYEAVPNSIKKLVMDPLLANNPYAPRIPLVSKAASYVQQARVPMPDRSNMYNLLLRLGLDEVLNPAFRKAIHADRPLAAQRATYAQAGAEHLINQMLAFDWKYTLADNDLPKVTGTTCLAGIDVAFPLLSDELIDFSLQLPVEYKLKGLKLRWFFKEALRDFLPEEIIKKKKQGFGLPFGVWALRHAPLARLADDAVSSFSTRGVVSERFLHRLRNDLIPAHPGYYGELVWIIMMLEHWLRGSAPNYRFVGN